MQHNITECGAVLIEEKIGFFCEELKNFVKRTLISENNQDTVQIFARCIYKNMILHSTLNDQKELTILSFNCNHPL